MTNLTNFYSTGTLATYELEKVVVNQNRTFALGDQDSKLFTSTDANSYTWTIPLNATTAFPTGSVISIYNEGAGDITVTADGAATLSASGVGTDTDLIVRQYDFAKVYKIDTDTWVFSSGGSSASTAKLMFMGSM